MKVSYYSYIHNWNVKRENISSIYEMNLNADISKIHALL